MWRHRRKSKLHILRMFFCGVWRIIYRQLVVWSTYLIVCSWVVLSGVFCRINTAGGNIRIGVGVAVCRQEVPATFQIYIYLLTEERENIKGLILTSKLSFLQLPVT